MSEKSYVSGSLTIDYLNYFCDLSNYAILSFLCHHVGDNFIFIPLIYYNCKLQFYTNDIFQIVKFTLQPKFAKKSFDSLCLKMR